MFEKVTIRFKETVTKDGRVFKPGETVQAEIWGAYYRVEKPWNAPNGNLIPRERAKVVREANHGHLNNTID